MICLNPFSIGLPDWEQGVAEGDIVTLGPDGALALEVMAVRGDKAWVRDVDAGRDGVIDLVTFRRLALDALGTRQ
jgi:hypothetical protein